MTDFRGFQEFRPGVSRYNGRISEEEWNRHKDKLHQLHEAKMTRQEILKIISSDFGDTKPTYGQLCTKFDRWGFHVYRQNDKKDTTPGKKGQRKNTKNDQNSSDVNIQQAFSPESSNGSTIVPNLEALDLSDKATPKTIADFHGTPQTQYLEPSDWSDTTPRATHSRNASDQMHTPPLDTIYEPEIAHNEGGGHPYPYPHENDTQQWVSDTSVSTATPSHGKRSSYSGTVSSRTSLYHSGVEPDDPPTIAARTRKADEALDAVSSYLKSTGQKQIKGEDIISMTSLAGYLFATRAYSSAFRIYHKIYYIMSQDMDCDHISKLGALMRCFQSAVEPQDLEFMQSELHQVLHWEFSDSSLSAFALQMLQSVETQISEGFNLAQGSVLSTTSVTRNLDHLMAKGYTSHYPGTKRLYWRLRLMKHSPFHSGCARLLRLMSELLSWAWAAMAVVKFPAPALQNPGCLCKDGMYFDIVRMVTTVILEAAIGFEISQLIRIPLLNRTPCECVMCADLESTFELCPVETFIAIALLTVDRCRLDWTSCHPGGRHQELTPQTILTQQLLPTVESLLDQVAADIRSPTTIHTSDLYDDFLSCIWSCFETHDLPLKNSRFDASVEKVEDLMTNLITDELNKSHPARNSMLDQNGIANGKQPVFTYGEPNDDLANKITAKRTRSNASSLKPSNSNASERSMIRIRKKLKYRTSADYLNSMSSYSSLSSRNSMNRFSYVTGLPELETVMDDEELRATLPPDLTPDEFRSMQRHDSWSRRSDHFSWVPSRPGSQISRGGSMSWRDSNGNIYTSNPNYGTGNAPASSSRPGSLNGMNPRRTSQKETAPHREAMQNSMVQSMERDRYRDIEHQNYSQNPMHEQMGGMNPPQYPASYQLQLQRQSQDLTALPPAYQEHASNASSSQPSTNNHNQNQQLQHQHQQQQQQQTPSKPQRSGSTKTTRSQESQRGRWSSERERVEKILRQTQ